MSICPKNKSSKARRDKRRANWKMSAPNLVKCSKCGALMMPHRVCKACGSYNKKEIVKVEINTDGRSLIFGDVVCRVSASYATAMHIDTDESNAAACGREVYGKIIK